MTPLNSEEPRWRGDDRLRPLSARGRAEATRLVDVLARRDPVRIVSSPLVRCVETVAPLSAAIGVGIERDPRLGPDAGDGAMAVVDELAAAGATAVVCTHGETIAAVQRELCRRTGRCTGEVQGPEKGSVWVLHTGEGGVVSADYLPPPVAVAG